MSGRKDDRAGDGRRPLPEDDLARRLVDELLCAPGDSGAPDLTRTIMGRLGYMQVPPHVARRRRARRWAMRATACAGALGVVAIGLNVHERGPDARRPSGPTIPAAIGRDVEQNQRRFLRTIQTIREIAPTLPRSPEPASPAGPEDLERDIDRSAVGPVRWM